MPSLDDKAESLKWLEIEISASPDSESELYALLIERRLGGWVVEDEEPRLVWVAYMACENRWEERFEELTRALTALGAQARVRRSVVDDDWANCWKQFYHARELGRTLVICPSWEGYRAEGKRVIHLDPGMAFGTGYHGSTANCLLLMEDYLLSHKAASVLDVGTGSGILAIAAAFLGAERVLATDIDPVAVRVASENVALNGKQEQVEVAERAGVSEGQYDLVIVNIVAAVIISLAEELARATRPGGCLIVSGIIEHRRDEVLDVLEDKGFRLAAEHLDDEWVSFRLERP